MSIIVAHAPGRVNLIGEHTDHQEGYVLPFAIDLGTTVTVRPRSDAEVRLTTSAGVGAGWERYPLAVVELLREEGVPVPGFSGSVESDLPVGEGLSSSAALLVATALAACELAGEPLEDRTRLATLCRRAEARASGVRCGIMDPFASLYGCGGRGLLIDCRSLVRREVDLRTESVGFLVADSGVRRALESEEYNRRREECEAAVRILRDRNPSIRTLRDANLRDLEAAKLPGPLHRRARHVVAENLRVLAAAAALAAEDLKRLGTLMSESHESLRRDFEVSCPELDALVEIARALPGVLGSRLTGAGFGGCTITAVRREDADSAREALASLAREKGGRDTLVREVHPSCGARVRSDPMP